VLGFNRFAAWRLATAWCSAKVAEMMRLLVDVMQVAWDEAWELSTQCDSVENSPQNGGKTKIARRFRRIWKPKFQIFSVSSCQKGLFSR